MSLPNLITLLRLFLVPIFVVAFYLPYSWAQILAIIIFAFAAFTDWLDGFLARTLSQTSKLGAFLDPVADKVVVAIALVLLVSESPLPYIELAAAIIIAREIVISALREWMAELGKRGNIAVSFVAKIKTTCQLISILMLLVSRPDSIFYYAWIELGGYALLVISAILTLWTMFVYIRAAWPEFIATGK